MAVQGLQTELIAAAAPSLVCVQVFREGAEHYRRSACAPLLYFQKDFSDFLIETGEFPRIRDMGSRLAERRPELLLNEAKLARAARYRVAELARLLKVDRFELHYRWILWFDCAPKEWLMAQRAQQAENMIEAGYSLQDMARLLFYQDAAHFARDFKERHGLTALQWRDQRPLRLPKVARHELHWEIVLPG